MSRPLKYLSLLFLVIFVSSLLFTAPLGGNGQRDSNRAFAAEQNDGPKVTAWQTDGGTRAINAQTGALNFLGFGSRGADVSIANASAAQSAIQPYAAQFGLSNAAQDLRLLNSANGQTGSTSYRFQQTYQGVPVIAGELIVNVNAAGRLAAISGEVSPNLNLNTSPGISSAVAVQQARDQVAKAIGVSAGSLSANTPELWIFDSLLVSPLSRPVQLVWRVEVSSTAGYPVKYLVLVGAQRGGIALAINQIDSFFGDAVRERQSANNTVSNAGSGGSSPLLLPNHNGQAITFDSNDSSSLNGTGASVQICATTQPGTPDQLTGVNTCDGTATATRLNAAHFFALDTFNYYDANHGRNSIDDAGMILRSNVDFTPNPPATYFNAFWDGVQMVYGNADFFSADDIVGHELSHGVTEHSSNLFYYYESGAINESLSDVFGEFVDQANGIDSFGNPDAPAVRWDLAEDLSIGALRDMQNPPTFGDPDRTQSPLYFDPGGVPYGGQGDQGGVHFNSGVNNKADYLMTDGDTFNGFTVTGIGITKVSAIYYEVNTTLLTSGSDYGVLYGALNQACQNLIGGAQGIVAADCVEVNEAALATEMQLEPSAPGYSPETTATCPDPADTPVVLYTDDVEGGIGNFDFVDQVGAGFWINTTFFGLSYSTSGVESLYGSDEVLVDTYATLAAPVTLDNGVSYFVYFKHAFGFEDYLCNGGVCQNPPADTSAYDGAVFEYTTDGTTWTDAQALFSGGQDYNVTIDASFGNTLGARPAFGYDSHGYVSSRYDLTSLDGSNVNFRWRIGTDTSVFDLGWFIDDVQVYSCGTPAVVPPPPPPPPPGQPGPGGPGVQDPAISKIGILAPGELGLPGEQITWVVTVTNTSGINLTNVVISDTLRPELRIDNVTTTSGSVSVNGQTVTVTLPFLSSGASVVVEIVTTVLSNPAAGVFTNTATVNADSGFNGSATATVSGVSGLPDTGYPPNGE